MVRTIGDISVFSEFERLREQIPAGSREVLRETQSEILRDVHTSKDAIRVLLLRGLDLVDALPTDSLIPDHPAIGALSTLLAHPEADRSNLIEVRDPEKRRRAEEEVAKRPMSWSAKQLQWQWVQYVATVGERVPLHPAFPLADQLFDFKPLQRAWRALLDLEVLWAWGLVS